ncbi:type III CRISPR-associated RAMP protein Csx7 [Clostridium diolis]|uniref:CRISPR-associated RAMP protein n=1 Tax=Clostridium diolis TaxID=223919 RepID=A0AAV3VX26_9CLOT|nr:CRISPR-associated RAMP protein Csx7 [Clostridium diolis]QES74235.1 CRISPR-associated RAMP protein [Clostridium diolis]GEA30793.1 CRISPR-associated RAMP protein [Clostridium diolis]
MYLLDRFENKYIIKGILKAESPIHIGTGTVDFSPTAVDTPVIRDENNNPFIPGSSLKGVLRSFMERLLCSGIFNEYKSCNILDKDSGKKMELCISDKEVKEIKEKYKNDSNKEEKIASDIYKKECDVCKLFGGDYFASKLNILDARLISDKAYVQIRDGIAIDRDTLTVNDGAKFGFECVAAGTEFNFEMTVDNLDDNHKDLLKIILNFLQEGEMKVGGKTSAGLGNVKLISKSAYCITKENMREYFINGINDDNKSLLEVSL